MFPLDFMVFGATKRYLSTIEAFRLMIETWNMICARALLRMHVDTALRFSAAWLVRDPHALATAVLSGKRIDHMRDKDGERLTDAYLVRVRSADHPWLPKVYESLSGYIHFSGSHIYDSIARTDDDSRTVHFEIAEHDTKYPARSWLELVMCAIATSEMFRTYLRGYATTKDMAKRGLLNEAR